MEKIARFKKRMGANGKKLVATATDDKDKQDKMLLRILSRLAVNQEMSNNVC
jgi:hypothetical protein